MVSGVTTEQTRVSLIHGVSATNTKDSLMILWGVQQDFSTAIRGFRVRYQAHGSNVVQYSHLLPGGSMDYEILHLHENTYYNICIQAFSTLSSKQVVSSTCIESSTATGSLSVALGSTFGAFLALGVIVFFVFLAKWNYNRKLAAAERYGSIEEREELSECSLAVNDDTLGAYSSGSSSARKLDRQNEDYYTHADSDRQVDRQTEDYSSQTDNGRTVDMQQGEYAIYIGGSMNPFATPDGRPPDVRPKDGPDIGLRPNFSCPDWLTQS